MPLGNFSQCHGKPTPAPPFPRVTSFPDGHRTEHSVPLCQSSRTHQRGPAAGNSCSPQGTAGPGGKCPTQRSTGQDVPLPDCPQSGHKPLEEGKATEAPGRWAPQAFQEEPGGCGRSAGLRLVAARPACLLHCLPLAQSAGPASEPPPSPWSLPGHSLFPSFSHLQISLATPS